MRSSIEEALSETLGVRNLAATLAERTLCAVHRRACYRQGGPISSTSRQPDLTVSLHEFRDQMLALRLR